MKNYLMGQQDPCIKDILQRLEHTDKVLDRLRKSIKRTFNGERFISDSDLSRVLRISRRTLQDYRSAGILPFLFRRADACDIVRKVSLQS